VPRTDTAVLRKTHRHNSHTINLSPVRPPSSFAARPVPRRRVRRRRRISLAILAAAPVLLVALAAVPAPTAAAADDPAPTPAPGASSALAAGGQGTCRITSGELSCGGANSAGQVGDGTTTARQKLRRVGEDADWAQVSTSGGHTCAVKTDSTLWCWGQNTRGQLGLGDKPQMWTPQQVGTGYASVSAGWLGTCAVRTDRSLWCWGNNDRGQLGLGDTGLRRAPQRVGKATNWGSVTVGGWHACGLRTDGTALCWGLNDLGQLGNGTQAARSTPGKVAGSSRYTALDASWSRTCGLTTTRALQCWGVNDQGQGGDGTRKTRTTPTTVAGGRSWRSFDTGDAQTCALSLEGALWCWGDNSYGQLGTGLDAGSTAPVRVAGGLTWTSVATGWMHSCGTTSDGVLRCFGNNEAGQLALGDRTSRAVPPGVTPPAQRRQRAAPDKTFTQLSFNVLDSVHTQPGGAALNYAPGRIRIEWAAALVRAKGADVVGFQEMSLDQARYLQPALSKTYDFYPKPDGTWSEVLNTVGWRRAEWKLVGVEKLRVPVLGRERTTHIVHLQNRQTGRDLWVLNAHNSPSKREAAVKERARALQIQLAKIQEKRADRQAVVFSGDMNDHTTVYCTVTRRTDLRSAGGGQVAARGCRVPTPNYLDWIFASPELKPGVGGQVAERNPLTARVTDHHVLAARLRIPGSSR